MKFFGLDSTALAGLAQSLAAVLAVLFGWGLSVVTERRSWRRRKTEQIREKQLAILSQIVLDLRGAIESAQAAAKVVDELADARARSADPKMISLLERDAEARFVEARGRLAAVVGQLEAQQMALRLIGFKAEGLAAIDKVLDPLRALADSGGGHQPFANSQGSREFVARHMRFRRAVSSFLDTGAMGLSG